MPEALPGRRRATRAPGPVRRAGRAASLVVHDIRVWVVILSVTVAALVLARTPIGLPAVVQDAAVLVATTALAVWLTVRAGGSPYLGSALALVIGGAAVATREPVLLVGAAVSTAAGSAVLGLMATAPAARFPAVLREYLLAIGVAVVGALTAAGYEAPVDRLKAYYLVVGLSLLGTFALVYKLGAGLHGLGRRGVVMVVAGTVLLFVVLAYTYALSRWGSTGLREGIDSVNDQVRDLLGAVPRPGQFLLGFPALVWGVSQRARRRQGWWFCAFGSVGLASVTVSLLGPDPDVRSAALGLGYSALIGLALGYAVTRLDAFLTGTRGRRARRAEQAAAHRPEPPRLAPLM